MRYIFNFPDIGEGLEEGTVLEWYVQKGQAVQAGDALVKVETDKVVADIPSPKAGTIVATFGAIGEVIHVGKPLVEIELEGVFGEQAVEVAHAPQVIAIEEEGAAVVGTLEVAGNSGYLPASTEHAPQPVEAKPKHKVLATPLARAIAKELSLDINEVTGTGPFGRVTKVDIENFHASRQTQPKQTQAQQAQTRQAAATFAPTESVTYEPLTQIRKTIAKRMLTSKLNAAHMTVFEEVEISELVRIREKYKKLYAEKNEKLTFLPFIVKATVLALKQHRQLNAQLDMENDRMIYHNGFHMGIAVDTAEGLVVPVVHDADRLSIFEIAQRISVLSEKAKNRKLTLEELKGGTFTLTNYGSIGGIFATPVINHPQAAILGIGRLMKKPIVKDDQLAIGQVLSLSLTVDHQIVDGGEASRFLNTVMNYLSDPVSLMME